MREQQRIAQENREKQLEARRRKIEDLKRREEERRKQVEERRRVQEESDRVSKYRSYRAFNLFHEGVTVLVQSKKIEENSTSSF